MLRKDLSFVAYAEGWALYAEQLACELGFYRDDPYGNVGRLQAEAFRAARLVVDTGIHAKEWRYDRAVDFMVENTGRSPAPGSPGAGGGGLDRGGGGSLIAQT
jgi:uncharacterized protein (DUF885 family)